MCTETLVKAAQKGDNDAFFMLIASYKDNLYNIAFCYLKNEHDALEAIQETTCRAYLKLHKLKEPKYFNTWLTKIIINYCIDEQKRKKKLTLINENIDISLENKDYEHIAIEAAVEMLPPKYKQVIVLKYFQDMKIEEIAKIIGRPEGTIKTWLYRALKLLKDILNKGGEYNV